MRPTSQSIEFVVKYITFQNEALAYASTVGMFDLVRRARKRFEHITLLHKHFSQIVEKLETAWKMRFQNTNHQTDSSILRFIRRSLMEIELLEISYSEFSGGLLASKKIGVKSVEPSSTKA
jgi:hypothetical protein